DQLQEIYEMGLAHFSFERMPTPKKSSTPEEVLELYNSEIKHLRTEAKDCYLEFAKYFVSSPTEQVEMIEATKQYVDVLANITLQFTERFQAYKAERKLVDF